MYIFLYLIFFFSSRRRHTRCALVTGVQTCALPIYTSRIFCAHPAGGVQTGDPVRLEKQRVADLNALGPFDNANFEGMTFGPRLADRSEERRVGKECVSTFRSRWSPYH